ncbi:MAG: BrnT family toxin [Steroidobacteraceae bacterium]
MRITFDPAKRAKTLADRGLDFADAALVFAGVTLEIEDLRKDYGEKRLICFGRLAGWIVVVGYTPRGAAVRHVFSMRKANEREQARVAPLLEI